MTRGDGVYSRYFGKYFRGAGTYSVTLSVETLDGNAYTIRSYPLLNGIETSRLRSCNVICLNCHSFSCV